MCQKICQVDIDSSPEAKGLAKKSKKDKEKKDKKVKKDKTDKKEKKQKRKEKKERKRKEAAQTEEDEDSDEAEAKRQRTAAATPQSAAPSTPATGEGDGDSPEVDKAVDKPPTEVVKPDDEKKKAEKAAKNNQALAQLALHRASTADLADKLDEDQVSKKSAPGSTTSQGSDAGDTVASDDADLTDKQKLVRHSHLNRFARAVKSTGLN